MEDRGRKIKERKEGKKLDEMEIERNNGIQKWKKKTTFKEKNYCFFPKEKWKENTNPRYWYTNDKITE